MAWKDQLRPASFRDVPFQVDSDDLTAGRRVQIFEYPQRDKPFSEDLGRAAREINITGYVIGTNYMAARDRLLGALEAPGPGTLMHPWYGSLQVIAKPARVTHSQDEGGLCRFSLVFVEAGERAFPSSSGALGARTAAAANDLEEMSAEDFAGSFEVDGWPDFVGATAINDLAEALDQVQGIASRVSGLVSNPVAALSAELGDLTHQPSALAGRVFALFAKAGALVATVAGVVSAADTTNYRRASGAIAGTRSFAAPVMPAGQLTAARQQVLANQTATQALMRRALLVQAASMVAAMPLPVYDDAVALRRDFGRALDDEALAANDEIYRVLQDTRAAAWQDIAARLDGAARLNTLTPAEPLPALVLAYDLYEDAGRDAEIAARNKVRHPGFVPAEPLMVLSA